MYTENYEQEIDLKDLFFAILYRWRMLLLAAVFGAVVFGGYRGWKINTDKAPAEIETDYEEEIEAYNSEQAALEKTIENLRLSIEEQNLYVSEAPQMQINPYNETVSTAEVFIQSELTDASVIDSLLSAYQYSLLNGEYMDDLSKEYGMESRYLKELVSVTTKSGKDEVYDTALNLKQETGMLYIRVMGTDSQMTGGILSAVLDELNGIGAELSESIGKHELTVTNSFSGEVIDTALLDRQQKVRGNINTLKNNLTDFETRFKDLSLPKADEAVDQGAADVIKYAVIGFIAGGFVVAAIVCAAYILNDKVASDKEIKTRFGLKVLGTFSGKAETRALGFVDRWLHRLAGDDKNWPEEAVLEMISTNVKNYIGEKQNVFITGMASEELMEKVRKQLKQDMPALAVCMAGDTISCVSARRMMAECEGIILVEEKAVSKYSSIQQELELANNIGMEVIGVVVG